MQKIENNQTTILVFLPHQDDEVFISPYLINMQRSNNILKVYYLTNGKYKDFSPDIRKCESVKALNSINISTDNIFFIGHLLQVEDGQVMKNFKLLYSTIKIEIEKYIDTLLEIVVPAWEGGHHDHDATNYLLSYIAEELKIKEKVVSFFTYNSQNVVAPFFNVMVPIVEIRSLVSYKFLIADGIKSFLMIFYHRSQSKTFAGLVPQMFYKLIVIRKIFLFVGTFNYCIKPHVGPILYERRNRSSFSLLRHYVDEFEKQ